MLRIARMTFCAFEAPNDQGAAGAVADKPDDKPDQEPAAKTVPLSELQKERRAKQALEQRLAERDEQDEQRRQADLTESERLKEQLAQAEARASEAERKAAITDRSRWVVDAAVAAGFEKPGAAVKLVENLGDLESEADAAAAVKQVADEYPGLLRTENNGGPNLEKVLQDGRRPDKKDGEDKLLTKDEINGLSQADVLALDESKPGLLDRSLEALNT